MHDQALHTISPLSQVQTLFEALAEAMIKLTGLWPCQEVLPEVS